MPYPFTKLFIDELYVGPAGSGEFYLVLSTPEPDPTPSIDLAAALADGRVTFVYSAVPVDLTQATAAPFVKAILNVLKESVGASRGFVWLQDPRQIATGTSAVMGLSPDGRSVQ